MLSKAKNRKIRSEKYAENEHVHSRRIFLASTPCMQPACSPACRASTPVCRASTPGCRASTPCTRRRRRECARVFQWRRLHLKRNAGCMQGVDAKKIRRELNLQPACRLHACCCNLQPPAYDRMQPACISSVALALHASIRLLFLHQIV